MRKGRSAGIIGFLCATAFGCGGGDFSPGDETSPAEPSSGAGGGGGDVEPSCGADGAGGEDKPGAGGQGGAPVAPDGCDAQATPSEASCVLDDSLGVFVRTDGDDAAAGTKAAPLRTLAKAIQMAAAQQKRVYACSQTFTEALVVPGGVEIYGGLACTTDWSWKSGEVTRIEAPAALAVRIAGGGAPALLSHLLITSIALDCGYAASSIRERIYVDDGGYGILLYTASPDAEGNGGARSHIRGLRPSDSGARMNLTLLPITHQATIPESYLDMMGHMNVMWYTHLFARATVGLFQLMGMDRDYFQEHHSGSFALANSQASSGFSPSAATRPTKRVASLAGSSPASARPSARFVNCGS